MRNLPRVELVYDPECPNVERARAAIRTALRTIRAPESWLEWERGAAETPAALRGLGSPSVLVDGRDVGCDETEEPAPDANACRVYMDNCGCLCGAPSADLILSALAARKAS